MEKEIETKWDIPIEIKIDTLTEKLKTIAHKNDFQIMSPEIIERNFQYYDTSNLDVYKKEETLRRVGGFSPDKHKGIFRYDFKVGPIEDRYEASHWSNKNLSPSGTHLKKPSILNPQNQIIRRIPKISNKNHLLKTTRTPKNLILSLGKQNFLL